MRLLAGGLTIYMYVQVLGPGLGLGWWAGLGEEWRLRHHQAMNQARNEQVREGYYNRPGTLGYIVWCEV